MISMDFNGLSLNFNDFQCVFNDVRGSSMQFNGVSMIFKASSMDLNDLQWGINDFNGFQWGFDDFRWPPRKSLQESINIKEIQAETDQFPQGPCGNRSYSARSLRKTIGFRKVLAEIDRYPQGFIYGNFCKSTDFRFRICTYSRFSIPDFSFFRFRVVA